VHPLREGQDPMNALNSMTANAFGRGTWAALTALVVDRPFTPARRARLRAAREADRAWETMMAQGDDPATLGRLAAIMSDKPRVCDKCGGNVYVCRTIGCDPEDIGTHAAPTALLMSGS
jgi:hypothetical protein